MLGSEKLVAFVTTADPSRAKAFYRDILGLSLVSEDSFALVFDANGTTLRMAIVKEVIAPPYTVLGWAVHDIEAVVKGLLSAGVKFEYYPQFMKQNELGIWTAPGGTRVAWFKDPDGNTLSVSQH
jgi:catechol 2,3-dioxygenase-like lactoylglutathione lyase family enzyme